jgi:outer membrane protein assembly factor BamD (BamD/ComL family)
MGDVYYNMREYVASKNAYDSAMNLGGNSTDSALVVARIRSGALGDITGPVKTIKTQDSLLALASLSSKEQLSAVRRYIRQLEDAKRDSAFRAENKGLAAAIEQEANNSFPGSGGTNYTNWYFSNAALMQQGYNEFKRKWPGRPLADNWRRSAALSMTGNSTNNTPANEIVDEEGEAQFDENGLPTEESLLSFIPNDSERKELALKRVRRGYVDLAGAYVQLLEDYPQALAALDTLDKRFPAHEHKAESIYLRYLVALRQNRLSEAQLHATALQTQYGDTKWAKLVRPAEDGEGLPGSNTGVPVATFYDDTYGMLLQRQYPDVLQRARDGQRTYTDVRYQKKFRIIEAIASVGVNDFDRADTLVTDFISNNPNDSLRAWADAVLAYIKKNRPATPSAATAAAPAPASQPGGTVPAASSVPPTDAMPPTDMDVLSVDPAKTPDAASEITKVTPPANPPAEYAYKPQEEHYVMFTFRNMEQRAMGVKAAMTDFNTFKFGSMKLDSKTEVVSPDLGLVVTRKFANAGQAKIYLNSLKGTAQVFREYKGNEYELLMISASNYLKLLSDKSLGAYLSFYNKNYK